MHGVIKAATQEPVHAMLASEPSGDRRWSRPCGLYPPLQTFRECAPQHTGERAAFAARENDGHAWKFEWGSNGAVFPQLLNENEPLNLQSAHTLPDLSPPGRGLACCCMVGSTQRKHAQTLLAATSPEAVPLVAIPL
jgi:hypothetical protein